MSLSKSKATGALCAALGILLGCAGLVGWAPTHGSTGVDFMLSGLALLGIAASKPQLTFIASGLAATLAAASLLEPLFGVTPRIAPAAAICFLVLAASFVVRLREAAT